MFVHSFNVFIIKINYLDLNKHPSSPICLGNDYGILVSCVRAGSLGGGSGAMFNEFRGASLGSAETNVSQRLKTSWSCSQF